MFHSKLSACKICAQDDFSDLSQRPGLTSDMLSVPVCTAGTGTH